MSKKSLLLPSREALPLPCEDPGAEVLTPGGEEDKTTKKNHIFMRKRPTEEHPPDWGAPYEHPNDAMC